MNYLEIMEFATFLVVIVPPLVALMFFLSLFYVKMVIVLSEIPKIIRKWITIRS